MRGGPGYAPHPVEDIECFFVAYEPYEDQQIGEHRQAIGGEADKDRSEATAAVGHVARSLADVEGVDLVEKEHPHEGVREFMRESLHPGLVAAYCWNTSDQEICGHAGGEP